MVGIFSCWSVVAIIYSRNAYIFLLSITASSTRLHKQGVDMSYERLKEKLILTLINSRRKRWRFKLLESLNDIDRVSIDWAYEDVEAIVTILEKE